MRFVEPKTFLIGVSGISEGLSDYLNYSGNTEFIKDIEEARSQGISEGEILCSFYAKLCYKSLSLGKNNNVTKIRDIKNNVIGCFDSGHGSVFEHCNLNFITTDCSRVFTHELVRHRVGTAFSQTSGRYVSVDQLQFVADPMFDDECLRLIDTYLSDSERLMENLRSKLIKDGDTFDKKKKVTSAIRRLAPNGQSNEIGYSLNIRSLRHTICLRTNPSAEWEIRLVFNQVADIIKSKWPLMLHGLTRTEVDGLGVWSQQWG